MAEDETTFLCGYKGLRRYGTTSSIGAKKPNYSSIIKHKVLPSDTLQGIALKYGTSTTEIKRLNKLWSNDSIHLREILHIPILSTEVSSPSGVCSTPLPPLQIQNGGRDSCYDSMSETEDHQRQNQQIPAERRKSGDDDEGTSSSNSTRSAVAYATVGRWSKRHSMVDQQQQQQKTASDYDKSDCSIKDLLSRIDSSIKQTATNVKRLEKQSTVEHFLNDNDSMAGTSMSRTTSRHSLRDAASTAGTPSPTEIRTEVRRPHQGGGGGSNSKYSLRKLQEVHDQLYQL